MRRAAGDSVSILTRSGCPKSIRETVHLGSHVNCKVSFRHRRLAREALIEWLRREFGQTGIDSAAWRASSHVYKDLDGIEDNLIWGGTSDGGRLLYGLLTESANQTLLWIEHNADSSLAFDQFKLVIRSATRSLMRTAGRLRSITVGKSTFYQEREERPLGLNVKISSAQTSISSLDIQRVLISVAVFAVGVATKVFHGPLMYGSGGLPSVSSPPPASLTSQLSTLSTYSDPAFVTVLVMIIYSAATTGYRWWRYRIEVGLNA